MTHLHFCTKQKSNCDTGPKKGEITGNCTDGVPGPDGPIKKWLTDQTEAHYSIQQRCENHSDLLSDPTEELIRLPFNLGRAV
jgi:hypothetical protein